MAQKDAERDAARMLARLNMESQLKMIHGLTSICHQKCVAAKYAESDLSVGENACLDRCVSKYFEMQAMLQQMMMEGQQRR